MQATDARQMQKSTVWGSGEIDGIANQREQPQPAPHVEGLYTGSLEVNGQLVPTARGYFYTDFHRGPILKWIPASPPQAAPGFGSVYGYEPAFLDPRYLPRDEYTPMGTHSHMDFWQACRHHLIWIVLFIVVGSILLEYGHWTYPHKESEVSE